MQVLVAVIDKLLNGRMTTIMAVPAQLVKMVRCEMSNVIAPQQHATLCMIQGQLVMLVSCTRSSVPSHPSPAHRTPTTHPARNSGPSPPSPAHRTPTTHPAGSSRATT
jgi:hypothetical protein